jgi:hypothetical protein
VSAANSIAVLPRRALPSIRLLVVCMLVAASVPVGAANRASASGVDHLVVSEVMTGGASASDELIELYNPSAASLPLEGLELVYVTASGATVSRRAAWNLGAPAVQPGAHVLVANELGIFAPIADALYASGMAATGGSVALRIQGASTAVDAVGWGTAASTWLEGAPAAAPPAGATLERLPGGPAGSTIDTDNNAADFTVQSLPDPQNSGSPPVPEPTPPTPTPGPTGTPTPSPTPTPAASATPAPTATPDASATPAPTATPDATPTPAPTPIPIAVARGLADDTSVTVEGDAMTASDFTEGGGYIADSSGGVAVLMDGGSFARGEHLIVTGVLDDRFAQRTIRATGDAVTVTGTGDGPAAPPIDTGSVDESVEARLVEVHGSVNGGATALSGGLAFDIDDGSGAVRVLVATSTGIDTAAWLDGVGVTVVGVVGQRDSTGTGLSGYRVQPRASDDIEVLPATTPTPSPSASPSSAPTVTPSPVDPNVIGIAAARAASKNARVTVRGVVTLASGTVESGSAAIQDATGAILLRLGDEAGSVLRGQMVEVAGMRSTKSGMETLRVSAAPRPLGSAPEPSARAVRSGDAGEEAEAQLVVVRGSVVASARTASSGTVSFEIDDGSGPLRIVFGASIAADADEFPSSTWVEVRGVLGQDTTGAQPLRGYRVWPRDAGDVRILAGATGAPTDADGPGSASEAAGGRGSAATMSLAGIGRAGNADLRVGATLVASAWPELQVAGLLWDGERLMGIAPTSRPQVERAMEGRSVPLPLELVGLREHEQGAPEGIDLVTLGEARGDTAVAARPPAPPATTMPGEADPPAWVALVGLVKHDGTRHFVEVDRAPIAIHQLCGGDPRLPEGIASFVGVGAANPQRIIVGCDGVRPAPVLGLTAGAQRATEPSISRASASVDPSAGGTDGRRLLPAVLLAAGVVVLVVSIAICRRLRSEEPDADEDEKTDLDPSETAGPQLSLVRLPNEHGP